MPADLRWRHHCVLEPYCYAFRERLITNLSEVIVPAEAKARELRAVPPPAGAGN
jgi:hypothetical protein